MGMSSAAAASSSSAAGADRSPSLALRHSHVLPVFVFDPRFLGAGRSAFGFQKSSHIRARFLRECVEDLRRSLRARGSDLLVCCGSPEIVIPSVCAQVDARAVYAFSEWAFEEQQVETATAVALQKQNVQLRTCSGGTLVHLDDLPFDIAGGFPQTFTQFRSRVERNFQVRPSAEHSLLASSVVLPLPPQVAAAASAPPQASAASAAAAAAASVTLDCSLPLPSFAALGYDESEVAAYRPDPRSAFPFAGGESSALARIRQYMWDQDRLRTYKETRNGMLGAEYSSKLSPFLAHVRPLVPMCVSYRSISAQRFDFRSLDIFMHRDASRPRWFMRKSLGMKRSVSRTTARTGSCLSCCGAISFAFTPCITGAACFSPMARGGRRPCTHATRSVSVPRPSGAKTRDWSLHGPLRIYFFFGWERLFFLTLC